MLRCKLDSIRSLHRDHPARFVVTLSGILLAMLSLQSRAAAEDFYSPGGWATLHKSPDNRKWVPDAALASNYRVWTALEGASVLTAPTLSPDGRRLYVTTGRGPGESNLHAFDLGGQAIWRAEPWQGDDRSVDPCAILSSVIVDRDGDLYVGDCDQVFAYHADGRLKWVTPLPAPRAEDWSPTADLSVNALTTAVFTREGWLLGVTNFGDVVVLDRATGRSLADPLRLPGRLPSRSTTVPMADSVFSRGLVDPAIREWAWQVLFGGAMRSTNTPAVELTSGRIFVAATSTAPGLGALYALDVTARPADGRVDVEVAWGTDMGPGSGSSPALSLEGDLVYVSDEAGVFYAIDAISGAIRWQYQTKATAAAAAVGGNGDVYALQAYGPALIAMTKQGELRWQSDLEDLAKQALPASWLLGNVVAVGNGNPTVAGDVVLVPIAYGYETRLGRRIPWLVRSKLVAVDVATGRGLRDVLTLADDSTGITVVLPDGTIINSLGTAITSAIEPLAGIAQWLLPDGLQLLEARGGIQVSLPIRE